MGLAYLIPWGQRSPHIGVGRRHALGDLGGALRGSNDAGRIERPGAGRRVPSRPCGNMMERKDGRQRDSGARIVKSLKRHSCGADCAPDVCALLRQRLAPNENLGLREAASRPRGTTISIYREAFGG